MKECLLCSKLQSELLSVQGNHEKELELDYEWYEEQLGHAMWYIIN